MVHAVLTIDDIASKNTRAIVDYLNKREIQAVMFAWGQRLEENYDNAIYALRHGMIVGNHSYSHPFFSKLSMEEAVGEIEKMEGILDQLYKDAGVERKYRPFRFPYGDRGGENQEALQAYFRENGFDKLKDTQIPYVWWKHYGLDQVIDTMWTFDFQEYLIRPGSEFNKESVFEKMRATHLEHDAVLYEENASHILLIHAHDETEEMVPGYFSLFMDDLVENGVVFDAPEFIRL